jgi:hypothetical protein
MPVRSLTSAPAQNTGPLPRTSTRRTDGSPAARFAAAHSSSHIAPFSALRASGRSSMMVARPDSTL